MHLCYFPNIAFFQKLLKEGNFEFYLLDQYSRQTFRNRTEILGPNGKLILSIPTQKLDINKRSFENIRISYSESWLKQHLKSLETAYRRSPYFEYYEDKISEFYKNAQYDFLWELNLESIKLLLKILKIDNQIILNRELPFLEEPSYREIRLKPYNQVFSNKMEFVPNLSVLDLIFNKGADAKQYLL